MSHIPVFLRKSDRIYQYEMCNLKFFVNMDLIGSIMLHMNNIWCKIGSFRCMKNKFHTHMIESIWCMIQLDAFMIWTINYFWIIIHKKILDCLDQELKPWPLDYEHGTLPMSYWNMMNSDSYSWAMTQYQSIYNITLW